MRTNKNVQPAKAKGVAATGNPNPKANMPANNVGMHPVNLGTTHNSKFAGNTKPGASKTGTVNNVGAKMNSTNYVNTGNKIALGNTKHGVGSVPAYLRNPANPK